MGFERKGGNSAVVSQAGKEGGYFQQNQQECDIPVPGGVEGREQWARMRLSLLGRAQNMEVYML